MQRIRSPFSSPPRSAPGTSFYNTPFPYASFSLTHPPRFLLFLLFSEIARVITDQLNAELEAAPKTFTVSRFVTLPHTEGCGMSSGSCEVYRHSLLLSFSFFTPSPSPPPPLYLLCTRTFIVVLC